MTVLEFRKVVVDERGRRYLDVSTDATLAAGAVVLVPLVVVKGEPNSATSNVATATSKVRTPTTSDLRDLLSEADAILLDSSAAVSSRMNASSSSSVRGSKSDGSQSIAGFTSSGKDGLSSKSLAKGLLFFSVIALSFAIGLVTG